MTGDLEGMKEVEISIKGLTFYILKRWKNIVAAMIVGAIVFSGLYLVRGTGVTQTNQSTLAAGDTLTDSERVYVDTLYAYLNELRLINENRSNSLIMNLNPEDLVKAELTYMISVDEAESLAGIEQAYKNYLDGSEFSGFISSKTGINNSDISDTVSISCERNRDAATNTTIKIVIVAADKTSADEIAKVVDSYIVTKCEELSQIGYEHELRKIGSSTYQGSDIGIQNRQLQYLQEIHLRNVTILDTESAIKDTRKDYYDSLVNGVDGKDTSEEEDKNVQLLARFSVRYIVLGLFAGAMFMCGIYLLIYIFANKLDENDNVEEIFGSYLIGIVTGSDYGKAIYKLQHFGKRSFDFDESINLIITKIKMTAQKHSTSMIGIIGCGIKKNNERVAKEIVDRLKKEGIETMLIDDPLYDPASAEKITGIEMAVILEKAGATYRREIWKEIEMIKKFDVKLDGIIISEQ